MVNNTAKDAEHAVMVEEDEIDELVSVGLAEALEEARKKGTELTKEDMKEVQKKTRASAKAQGQFRVIQRSKKVNGKPTLVGGDVPDGS